jgi:hypothetical protein
MASQSLAGDARGNPQTSYATIVVGNGWIRFISFTRARAKAHSN